ncbi:MAG TPA: hypothetical protein PKD67_00220 [Ignavibacteriaceae bacterium]|nr:hypothetical protein [Ignavibacteriaceae bacterium]
MKSFIKKILSNNFFYLILIILSCSNLTSAQVLQNFSEKIYLSTNGNTDVNWKFIIQKNHKDRILLPWSFPESYFDKINFNVYCCNGQKINEINDSLNNMTLTASLKKIEGTVFLELNSIGIKDSSKLEIKFTLPEYFVIKNEQVEEFGNYTFKKKFVNTTSTQIKNFSSEIILPSGYVITSVLETIPKQASEDPVSPFQISRTNELNSVIIKTPILKLGDNTFIKFRFKSESKSPILMILFVIVGGFYLIYFRDIIKSPKNNLDKIKT